MYDKIRNTKNHIYTKFEQNRVVGLICENQIRALRCIIGQTIEQKQVKSCLIKQKTLLCEKKQFQFTKQDKDKRKYVWNS